MKRIALTAICSGMLLSSCGTYTGSGAFTGAHFGSILGSAIGGISGGPRGSNVGTILGMAGGAAVGAAIGSAADKQSKSEIYEYNDADYNSTYSAARARTYEPDRYTYSGTKATRYNSDLVIRNLRFVDDNMDGVLSRGETSKIIFEVMNTSNEILYDVCPLVNEVSGNKHIIVSPGMHIEQIAPGKGIRYTAIVQADNRLKDGTASFKISVVQGNNLVSSKVSEFDITTRR